MSDSGLRSSRDVVVKTSARIASSVGSMSWRSHVQDGSPQGYWQGAPAPHWLLVGGLSFLLCGLLSVFITWQRVVPRARGPRERGKEAAEPLGTDSQKSRTVFSVNSIC